MTPIDHSVLDAVVDGAPKTGLTTRPRSKRTTVPTPEASTPSAALDTLTGAGAKPVITSDVAVQMPTTALRPHPSNPAHRSDSGFEDLAARIKAEGKIHEPLVVRPAPGEEGVYEVLSGARRLAAAQLLAMLFVDVRIVDVDDAAAVRMVLAANLDRMDFTPAEEAALVQDALDLGMTDAQLAADLGRGNEWIARRRAVAKLSPSARAVVDVMPDLEDLAHAAAIAEFDDDPEKAIELRDALVREPSRFPHALEEARQDRAREEAIAAKRDEYSKAGVTLLDAAPRTWEAGAEAKDLSDLSATAGGKALTPEDHAACPGRAVFVDTTWRGDVLALEYCMAWKTSGHFARHATQGSGATSGPMTDEQKAERKHLVETNKASGAAEVVRRGWIKEFLARDKMPTDAAPYIERMLNAGYGQLDKALAAELTPDNISTQPTRALHRLVALAAAYIEHDMPKDYWRHTYSHARIAPHLAQLAAWGYPLAPHEQDVVDAHEKAAAKGRA